MQPQLYAVSAFASPVALVVVVVVIVLAAKKLVKDVQNYLMPWPSLMLCHQCHLKRFERQGKKLVSQKGDAGQRDRSFP